MENIIEQLEQDQPWVNTDVESIYQGTDTDLTEDIDYSKLYRDYEEG